MTQPTNTTAAQLVRTLAGSDTLGFTVFYVADELFYLKYFYLITLILAFLRELGRQEKESMQKILAITKEGFLLKQQLIQEAKRGIEEKKVRRGKQTEHNLFFKSHNLSC